MLFLGQWQPLMLKQKPPERRSAAPSDRASERIRAGCASCSRVAIGLAPPCPARPH